jgi:rhomboid protease GluP
MSATPSDDAPDAASSPRRRPRWPLPPATTVLAVAFVAVYGLERRWGGATNTATLVRMGACVPSLVRAGEWWRLLACAMLHAGSFHLQANVLALVMLGISYEPLLGSSAFVVVFVVAALGGSVATTLLSPAQVMVGASGGLFGFIGVATALAIHPGGLVRPEAIGRFRRSLLVNLALQLFVSLLPQVSLSAHLGGWIVGVVLGLGPVRPIRTRYGLVARRRGAAAFVCAALLVASVALAFAHGRPWVVRVPRAQSGA